MNAAGISGVPRTLGGAMSAPGQGTSTEKKVAPAETEPDIPHIPHFPRNRHADGVESGNVGKEGKPPAAARPDQNNLGQGLVGLGAQGP